MQLRSNSVTKSQQIKGLTPRIKTETSPDISNNKYYHLTKLSFINDLYKIKDIHPSFTHSINQTLKFIDQAIQ